MITMMAGVVEIKVASLTSVTTHNNLPDDRSMLGGMVQMRTPHPSNTQPGLT